MAFPIAATFVELARSAHPTDHLFDGLARCCAAMNIPYFALSHHVDFRQEGSSAIRLHNYPISWEDWFDDRGLGRTDPIHRASHLVNVGFAWSAVPEMIKLTPEDRTVLDQAYRLGIGDGFTIPANVPGEMLGSCSFAVEAGRRLTQARALSPHQAPTLTDRQRDCVLWAARGKTDWEISRILGIGHETVIQHLKHARERYGRSFRFRSARCRVDGRRVAAPAVPRRKARKKTHPCRRTDGRRDGVRPHLWASRRRVPRPVASVPRGPQDARTLTASPEGRRELWPGPPRSTATRYCPVINGVLPAASRRTVTVPSQPVAQTAWSIARAVRNSWCPWRPERRFAGAFRSLQGTPLGRAGRMAIAHGLS